MSWKYYFYIKQINILKTVFNFTLNQDLICLPHIGKTRGEQKNRLKFKKNRPVRFDFGFISLKLKKTEPNRKKPSQTGKKPSQARKKPIQTGKPSQTGFVPKITEPNRNWSVWTGFSFIFLKKISFGYFFDKNQTEPKWK